MKGIDIVVGWLKFFHPQSDISSLSLKNEENVAPK